MTGEPPDAAKAIEILTSVLDFYDGGRQWVRGDPLREGRRCLMSAILFVAGRCGAGEGGDARHYLRAALALSWTEARPISDVDLIDYNDDSDDYDEVHPLIVQARALAQAELDAITVEVNDLYLVGGAAK